MRNTVQKALILEAVLSSAYHPTADDVYREVSELCPAISRATVYRNLSQLAESGEIRRVGVPNAPDRFDRATDSHGHFICLCCGRVWDVAAMIPTLPDGFEVRSSTLIISGICGECSKDSHEVKSNNKI